MPHENANGKISRIYTHSRGCEIRIDCHGDDYFLLEKNHSNYNSLYSLVLIAAINRYDIWLRLGDYNPPEPPSNRVVYAVIDWPQ